MDLRFRHIPPYGNNKECFIFYFCMYGSSHPHGRWYPSWGHWSRKSRTPTRKFLEHIACSKTLHESTLHLLDNAFWYKKKGRIHTWFYNHIRYAWSLHYFCWWGKPSILFVYFSNFIAKYDYDLLPTHVDDTSILRHEIFSHLNFKYMQQLWK